MLTSDEVLVGVREYVKQRRLLADTGAMDAMGEPTATAYWQGQADACYEIAAEITKRITGTGNTEEPK